MIIDSDSKAINGQTIVADGGWTLGKIVAIIPARGGSKRIKKKY